MLATLYSCVVFIVETREGRLFAGEASEGEHDLPHSVRSDAFLAGGPVRSLLTSGVPFPFLVQDCVSKKPEVWPQKLAFSRARARRHSARPLARDPPAGLRGTKSNFYVSACTWKQLEGLQSMSKSKQIVLPFSRGAFLLHCKMWKLIRIPQYEKY